MRGLLLKDYYMIRKYGLFLFALGMFYTVAGSINLSHASMFFSIFLFLYMGILTNSAMNLEEKSHWEGYAVMLPYSRAELVAEKYLFSLINIGFSAIVYGGLNLVLAGMGLNRLLMKDILIVTVLGSSIGLLLPSLSLPWMFWLGGSKGRICMIVSVGVITAIIGAVSAGSGDVYAQLSAENQFAIVCGIITLVVWGLSMLISMGVYARREL